MLEFAPKHLSVWLIVGLVAFLACAEERNCTLTATCPREPDSGVDSPASHSPSSRGSDDSSKPTPKPNESAIAPERDSSPALGMLPVASTTADSPNDHTQAGIDGSPCDDDDDCGSNQCVDGICCHNACTGACERCDGGLTVSQCVATECGDAGSTPIDELDTGMVSDPDRMVTTPDAATSDVELADADTTDSEPELNELGAPCKLDADCESSHCASSANGDSICCATTCDGLCEACGASGSCDGTPLQDSRCPTLECGEADTCFAMPPSTDAGQCTSFGHCSSESDYCLPTPDEGASCGSGLVCDDQGECNSICDDTEVYCGSKCIDPLVNDEFCGANAQCQGASACDTDEACLNGICRLQCAQNQVNCDEECFDPLRSWEHCGAKTDCVGANAGAQCTADESCSTSSCRKWRTGNTIDSGSTLWSYPLVDVGGDGSLHVAWAGGYAKRDSGTWSVQDYDFDVRGFAVLSDGTPLTAAQSTDGDGYLIVGVKAVADSNWTQFPTENNSYVQPDEQLRPTSSGAILIWMDMGTIYTSIFDGSSWSPKDEISDSVVSFARSHYLTTNGDNAVVTFTDNTGTELWATRWVNGSWTAPERLASGRESGKSAPVALTPSGEAHVVWEEGWGNAGDQRGVRSFRWNGSRWTAIDTLSATGASPAIASNANGDVVAAWGEGNNIRVGRWTGGGFSVQTVVGATSNSLYPIDVAVSSTGLAAIVWSDAENNVWGVTWDGQRFSTPFELEGESSITALRPQVAFRTDGSAWAVWSNEETTEIGVAEFR